MSRFTLQISHLKHLNEQLARLMAKLDDCCHRTAEPMERRRREVRASIAHGLLDNVLAEHAVATRNQPDTLVDTLEMRLLESQTRIDELRARLAFAQTRKRPDFVRAASSR